MTLRERLRDGVDWDGASYELGIALGLFDEQKHSFQRECKHVFWSRNDVGEGLPEVLEQLVKMGVLEGGTDGMVEGQNVRFRWNESFIGSWDKRSPLEHLAEVAEDPD